MFNVAVPFLQVIYEAVDPNANIIFGALVDGSMDGEIAITVIATGFPIQGQSSRVAAAAVEEVERPRTVADAKRLAASKADDATPTKGGSGSSGDDDVPDFINKLRRRK